MKLETRISIEKQIVTKTVKTLLAAGYALSVDNGGDEEEITKSKDEKAILKVMMETDFEVLIAHNLEKGRFGSVVFVYGNDGWDVINDYSTSLETVLGPVNALADKLEAKHS